MAMLKELAGELIAMFFAEKRLAIAVLAGLNCNGPVNGCVEPSDICPVTVSA